MVLSGRYGLKIVSFRVWNEYINSGFCGFARGYVTSVEACSRTNFLQSEPGSVVSQSIKFSKQYCSEANRKKKTPLSMIFKGKQDINGRSVSNPLMPRKKYVKRRMPVETRDEEEPKVKEGDVINLMNLLFTENRDYLVKHSDDQKVKAEQLAGKAILLYFVPVFELGSEMEKERTTYLVDIYNDLQPNNDFEVIFVAVNNLCAYSSCNLQSDPQKKFEEIFSQVPWTAIPFSDIASRKRIARRFSILEWDFYCAVSYFLDSKGVVLTCNACPYFGIYGTLGYPFSDERLRYLDSEDDEAAKQPSLETLLGSPIRDYVISNKEERVPIHSLKDKVVALYFYEDGLTDDELTIKLKMAYKELAKNNKNFEVVLLYLYDTVGTLHSTNEESFWKIFKTMPWLALPFKDPNHKKLVRIFGYPHNLYGPEPVPTLVIIGPNGKFVDPCGADILMNFSISSYPFTRKRLAQLETEKIKDLKPEMLWDPNTAFRVKNDWSKMMKLKLEMLWDPVMLLKHVLKFLPNFYPPLKLMIPDIKVPFSQFAGKRLLIYFEMGNYCSHFQIQTLQLMKRIYLRNQGTDDEFEVIHIKKSPSHNKHVADVPWLAHYYDEGYSLSKELERSFFNFNNHYSSEGIKDCLLLAIERDGSIVRKTFYPTFDKVAFPFYAGGLEKEFLYQLNYAFGWYYWEFPSRKQIYRRRLKRVKSPTD